MLMVDSRATQIVSVFKLLRSYSKLAGRAKCSVHQICAFSWTAVSTQHHRKLLWENRALREKLGAWHESLFWVSRKDSSTKRQNEARIQLVDPANSIIPEIKQALWEQRRRKARTNRQSDTNEKKKTLTTVSESDPSPYKKTHTTLQRRHLSLSCLSSFPQLCCGNLRACDHCCGNNFHQFLSRKAKCNCQHMKLDLCAVEQ